MRTLPPLMISTFLTAFITFAPVVSGTGQTLNTG
jgi:hypothetical protein